MILKHVTDSSERLRLLYTVMDENRSQKHNGKAGSGVPDIHDKSPHTNTANFVYNAEQT